MQKIQGGVMMTSASTPRSGSKVAAAQAKGVEIGENLIVILEKQLLNNIMIRHLV